jgi:hypothetical protein
MRGEGSPVAGRRRHRGVANSIVSSGTSGRAKRSSAAALWGDCICPKAAVRAMPARLLLLCLLFRSTWLTVEAGRHVAAGAAASPGRTGSLGRIGQRGLVAFQLANLAASSPDFRVLGWMRWSRAADETSRPRPKRYDVPPSRIAESVLPPDCSPRCDGRPPEVHDLTVFQYATAASTRAL